MALDGYFIKNLVTEVATNIQGGRVEKIIQIDKDLFVFQIYLKKVRQYLYFKLNSPNGSFFINDSLTNLENLNSNFLVALKHNLEGYIINDIKQYNLDRVVTFELVGNDLLEGRITKNLVVELMGRHNNLILLSSENIIIDAYHKKFDANSRSIIPKLKFEYFPTTKIPFDNIHKHYEDNLFYSKNFIGISPLLSKYLNDYEVNLDTIKVIPIKNTLTNQFYWFDIFNNKDTKIYETLNQLLASNVLVKQTTNNKYINFINKELIKNNKLLENLKSSLEESNKLLEYRNIADGIYSCGLDLNKNYTSFIHFDGNTYNVDGKLTLLENAKKYYKTYQKAKRSLEHLNKQIDEVSNLINLLNQFDYDLNGNNPNYQEIEEGLVNIGLKVKKQKQPKNKKTKKIEPIRLEYNNAIFYIGKNNIQNEYVTHEIAKHNDYWFHIKDAPGSHVILKGELNDTNLEIASMLAANYSKEALNPLVSINYTLIKNIKKIPGLKGYNVIVKDFKTVNISVDKELLRQIFIANHLNY